MLVSHDRYFLDRVCNAIVEIQDTRAKGYHGNYTSFLQQKELFLQTLADRIKKTDAEVKRLTGALQSMKRANKYDKSISQKRFLLARSQGELRWLKSLKPRQRRGLNFRLESTEKSSLEVLDFRDATLTFEGLNRPIIKGLEVGVSRGQKIGIVGPNGAGKTTILRIIQGELELDSGSIDGKPGVQIGYFHQDHRSLNFDLTPVDQIRALKPRMDYGDIRALLGRFQFTSEMVETKLEKLSGGERARIALLKLLLEENNLLLLDEPTNHLDTDAKEALEEALVEYDGSIITVSHDRFFLDRICDTIWELPADGSLWIWPGNYSDFIRRKRASRLNDFSHNSCEIPVIRTCPAPLYVLTRLSNLMVGSLTPPLTAENNRIEIKRAQLAATLALLMLSALLAPSLLAASGEIEELANEPTRFPTANGTIDDSDAQTLLTNLNANNPIDVMGVMDDSNRIHLVWIENTSTPLLRYALIQISTGVDTVLISTTQVGAPMHRLCLALRW